MYTELSLFSAYPLLSAYYLTVYIYRRMRLTIGVYGISPCTCSSCYGTCATCSTCSLVPRPLPQSGERAGTHCLRMRNINIIHLPCPRALASYPGPSHKAARGLGTSTRLYFIVASYPGSCHQAALWEGPGLNFLADA